MRRNSWWKLRKKHHQGQCPWYRISSIGEGSTIREARGIAIQRVLMSWSSRMRTQMSQTRVLKTQILMTLRCLGRIIRTQSRLPKEVRLLYPCYQRFNPSSSKGWSRSSSILTKRLSPKAVQLLQSLEEAPLSQFSLPWRATKKKRKTQW